MDGMGLWACVGALSYVSDVPIGMPRQACGAQTTPINTSVILLGGSFGYVCTVHLIVSLYMRPSVEFGRRAI
jgi:hypothetical protein